MAAQLLDAPEGVLSNKWHGYDASGLSTGAEACRISALTNLSPVGAAEDMACWRCAVDGSNSKELTRYQSGMWQESE